MITDYIRNEQPVRKSSVDCEIVITHRRRSCRGSSATLAKFHRKHVWMIMWHVTLLPPDAILSSKCTKNALRPGLCPGPRWGSLQRSPRPLAVFEGAASRQGRKGKGGEGKGGKGKEGEGNGPSQLWEQIDAPWLPMTLTDHVYNVSD